METALTLFIVFWPSAVLLIGLVLVEFRERLRDAEDREVRRRLRERQSRP